MATTNQVRWAEHQQTIERDAETQRANKAREKEATRSNKAREKENTRHNKMTEKQTTRSQNQELVRDATKASSDLAKIIGSINDPSWYNKDKQLVKDVSNFAFGKALGTKARVGEDDTFPGFMVIKWLPALGPTNGSKSDMTTAINIAAKKLDAKVRKPNSGSKNYGSADLILYIYAMLDAVVLWGEAIRAYSIMTTYKLRNRYYGESMFTKVYGAPEDLDLAQFRAEINKFAQQLNAIAIPGDLPVFKRALWLATNIFKDQPVDKSQVYLFKRQSFGVLDDLAGAVVYNIDGTTPFQSVASFKTAWKTIMNGILNSDDMATIDGDIQKAYSDSQLWRVPSIDEDYHIESIYSEEVLTQINGIVPLTLTGMSNKFVAIYSNPDGNAISQQAVTYDATAHAVTDVTSLFYSLINVAGNMGPLPNQLQTKIRNFVENNYINMYKDDVSADDAMVATRLTVAIKQGNATIGGSSTVALGTEFVVGINIYAFQESDGVLVSISNTRSHKAEVLQLTSAGATPTLTQLRTLLSQGSANAKFDWAPRFTAATISLTTGGSTEGRFDIFDDVANYSTIEFAALESMHEVACTSEFGV